MTSLPEPKRPDTSTAVPDGEYRQTTQCQAVVQADSSAVSANPGLSKIVAVRGPGARNSIVVPYHVERERRRGENLEANGWANPQPSTRADLR
jgi:hypothetical protein